MTLGHGRERVKINVIPWYHKAEPVDSSDETNDWTSSNYSSTSEVDIEDEESEVDVSVMDIFPVTSTHEPIKLSKEKIDDHLQQIKIGDVEMERFIFVVENSEWVSPIVISIKNNGKLHIFVDYMKLNKAKKKDHYPLPFSNQILDEVASQECYSFADGYNRYNKVRIAKKDQLNTMFTTPWGTFSYRFMPFGLFNALATFHCFMNRVFEPYIGNFIRVFLYYFYIYGSKMDHLHQMETSFQRLDEAQASLNPTKCVFGCFKGILLGHVVSRDGIGTDPDKFSKIKDLPFPMNRSKLRSFLGHVGYYRRFIKNFSKITQPLTQFLKKDVTYEPGNKVHEDFEQLKEALASSPILKNPD
ncbi:hypothetical protein KI387_044059 [Taxus chinensis]|uniref:Reverse transcriptase domain-containing protein n=1 Tax=Taxus chinensis TaxID=29808 RepID=A0AA38G0L3_TAXCH|nr:hypothetical protein KI387_044059 [Taxus chinensis]